VNASKRDWPQGASIFIPVGSPLDGGGITYYKNAFYVYPGPEGSWLFMNYNARSNLSYPDLESAVGAAFEALKGPPS
jgi:hypothetical protein